MYIYPMEQNSFFTAHSCEPFFSCASSSGMIVSGIAAAMSVLLFIAVSVSLMIWLCLSAALIIIIAAVIIILAVVIIINLASGFREPFQM